MTNILQNLKISFEKTKKFWIYLFPSSFDLYWSAVHSCSEWFQPRWNHHFLECRKLHPIESPKLHRYPGISSKDLIYLIPLVNFPTHHPQKCHKRLVMAINLNFNAYSEGRLITRIRWCILKTRLCKYKYTISKLTLRLFENLDKNLTGVWLLILFESINKIFSRSLSQIVSFFPDHE